MKAFVELRRALFVVVLGAMVGCFAFGFRESAIALTELLTGEAGAIRAAAALAPWQRALLAGGTVVVAWVVARTAVRLGKGRLGLSRLASSARGSGEPPSLPVTLLHSLSTWLVTVGVLSIGRESAIIETGGSMGACAVRNDSQRRPSMIAAGVAAAFAAAYHAPFSAVAYVEEHIGIRSSVRSLMYAVLGSASGVATVTLLFEGSAVLPGLDRLDGRVVGLAAIGVLPAIVASLAFRVARERFPKPETPRLGPAQVVAAAVAIGAVVLVPNVAGNGLEALRVAADHPSVSLALTLMLLKLVATTSLMHAGVPGGVFSPSLAVGAGAALATLFA
ncbi:MAG: chloride channel protein, partial [Ilumatobacteraceae bacterium]